MVHSSAINQGGPGNAFAPKIGNLQILDTGKTSLTLSALVNFTNPTEYSATVPYIDINILTNGTLLGHATARSVAVGPGENSNIPVTAIWDPFAMGGEEARAVGVELLSQYISGETFGCGTMRTGRLTYILGFNTTLTLRTHNDSIPSQPSLGRALARFAVEMPTPSLGPPGEDDGDGDDDGTGKKGPHFIEDATVICLTLLVIWTVLIPVDDRCISLPVRLRLHYYHRCAHQQYM